MKKVLVLSLCTSGTMREQFIDYCSGWSNREEYDLYCITNDNVSNEEIKAKELLNVRFKRKEVWSYFSLIKQHKIKKFIKRVNPDLIFIFTPHPVNLFLFRFLKRYLIITQIHDPEPHSGVGLIDRIILNAQLKRYYKYSNYFSVAGEALKSVLVNKYHIDGDRVFSIPLALLPSHAPSKNYQRNVEKDIDMIFYGRIEYYKGLDVLMNALNHILQPVVVYILGKGEVYFKQPDNCKSTVKIINRFVYLDELEQLIARSKIAVLPYRDATGSVMIPELFAYNLPIIATDVGVFKEYVGNAGIIVPANNEIMLAQAIEELLSNNDKREDFAKKGLELLENKFNIDFVCDEYHKAFKRIIEDEEK